MIDSAKLIKDEIKQFEGIFDEHFGVENFLDGLKVGLLDPSVVGSSA